MDTFSPSNKLMLETKMKLYTPKNRLEAIEM